MSTITVKGLTKIYRPFDMVALRQIDLALQSQEFLSIIGPSGCGKTTLLKCIAGLERADEGDIFFDERKVNATPAYRREAVMVFQSILLFPHLSVFENIAFGLRVRKQTRSSIDAQVMEALAQVKLAHCAQKKPHHLSGGEQQRIALARALIIHPKILLLDEPLANLDRHLWRNMAYLIKDLHTQYRITTILVTHNQEEALLLSDRIAVMFRGRIVQVGKDVELYQQPRTLEVAQFFNDCNMHDAQKKGSTIIAECGRFHIDPTNGYTSCPDGDVVFGIRPEAIECALRRTNSLRGTVVSSRFTGTQWRTRIKTTGAEWEALGNEQHTAGTAIHIFLPSTRVMLFPK